MLTNEELSRQLNKQLAFLRRSCSSFDTGYTDEAIRIALTLRVLFHERGRSKSLIGYFGKSDLRLLTTCPTYPPRVVYAMGSLSTTQLTIDNGATSARIVPKLDSSPTHHRFVSVQDWWQEVIYVMNGVRLTRQEVIRTASDKDGGAHVDQALTPEYELLKQGLARFVAVDADGRESEPVPLEDVHLYDLRQMGHEVLNSPDILDLASR